MEVFLIALWMLCNCRNGVSSYEIARATGIAQKSAWFVLQRLRLVLKETRPVALGAAGTPVEMDECFIGGKPKNMHRSRARKLKLAMNGYAEKTVVFGMLERGTRQVRATVIPNVHHVTLQAKILENVGFGATVYLRYEIRREFAPYIGFGYQQSYDIRETRILNEGGSPNGLQLIFGIRAWH